MKFWILVFLGFASLALADARQVDDYQWEGVERIVAIGDLHGDYQDYLAVLRAAGLIDQKGKWIGGSTHLVQTGDVPDRGPDTAKIIEHIIRLGKQARRKGGEVHSLIGNHEAMNVTGDLRYVHPGEYEAFVNRNSAAFRDRYYDLFMKSLKERDPERFAALPEDFREQWNAEYPLGWVEHRRAWDPAWNPEGEFANWVLGNKVAIRINDLLFVHGGISGFYCQNSLDSLTEKARQSLRNFDPENPGILQDGFGPLWYRGLSGVEPTAAPETVDAILARHGVRHIVVGHTPTSGVIWPNYDGKVVMIDTGISHHYGGYLGYLEETPEGLFGGYPGARLALPSRDADVVAYLERVIELEPDNPYLKQRLRRLLQPELQSEPSGSDTEAGAEADGQGQAAEPAVPEIPICGSVP
jgi:hypothetical protein